MGRDTSILALLCALFALLSPLLFPLPFAAGVALAVGSSTPLVPLAVGLLADALYWSGAVYPVPLYTICGALASLFMYGVRRFFKTSIMR